MYAIRSYYEIKQKILDNAKGADVAIVEVGGTVGDIESLPFLEAIRQFRTDRGHENVLYVHLTLVPYIATAGELKTKPTQHSVKELREIVITSYSIHYTKLYDLPEEVKVFAQHASGVQSSLPGWVGLQEGAGFWVAQDARITSYNVCYTKLLRGGLNWQTGNCARRGNASSKKSRPGTSSWKNASPISLGNSNRPTRRSFSYNFV